MLEAIQLKATDSVAHVKHALEVYLAHQTRSPVDQ